MIVDTALAGTTILKTSSTAATGLVDQLSMVARTMNSRVLYKDRSGTSCS